MDVPECPGCRALLARNAELEARILALEGQVRDLLNRHKPPTAKAATPQPPAPAKKPTGKKPGGQPGHPPAMKALVPPERVNHVVPYIPERCEKCDEPLSKEPGVNDPEPKRHQVAELPKIAAEITEHQAHGRTCPCCGEVTWATIPADIRAHSVGPKMTAAVGYFVAVHGVSKRGAEEIVEHMFETPIALGTIANLEQELSAALMPAHEEARQAIAAADVKYTDETGWKKNGKKRWLWVSATATIVYFVIHARRNLDALKRVAGAKLIGIMSSDRWCVYADWPGLRQLCWAHVKRNWEKQIERGGSAPKRLGEAWLNGHRQVFELWHRFRAGGCSRKELDERMKPLFVTLNAVLGDGRRTRDVKFARFCTRLTKDFAHLWTFVTHEGVEPTNNHAERVLRRAVLWRRRSFGCHSDAGCRFVERILTVVQSLRQQKRSVLEFLGETIATHRAGKATPRLVTG